MPEHLNAKFQITQVLVDDGGTPGIAMFFGISRYSHSLLAITA
jgi:hypothetical protein